MLMPYALPGVTDTHATINYKILSGQSLHSRFSSFAWGRTWIHANEHIHVARLRRWGFHIPHERGFN